MVSSGDLSRDPAGDYASDQDRYDEDCGPESFHPTLILDSAPVTYVAEGSRSSDLQQHHSALYGRRTPARDIFHSSFTHCDAANVQQRGHEWGPLVDNPDPVHVPGSIHETDPFRVFVAPVSPWTDGMYNSPAASDSLSSNVGRFPPPINSEFSPWSWGVYTRETFTQDPNSVSGGTAFSQISEPSIQPPYSPHCAARLVLTIENTQSNHTQLPRSESQGPSLIANQNHNSSTQHSRFGGGLPNSDPSFSPKIQMSVIPQRPYARMGDREKYKPIIFKVNGQLGISARDAIRKSYAGLEGRDDQVFVGRPSVIMLRLEWPGYPSWSRKIRLNDWKKSPQRISLEKLATEVTKCLERFIREVQAGKYPDRECSDWSVGVGPEFIGIDRLVLVALDNVSRGSWQPRIGLLSG